MCERKHWKSSVHQYLTCLVLLHSEHVSTHCEDPEGVPEVISIPVGRAGPGQLLHLCPQFVSTGIPSCVPSIGTASQQLSGGVSAEVPQSPGMSGAGTDSKG